MSKNKPIRTHGHSDTVKMIEGVLLLALLIFIIVVVAF